MAYSAVETGSFSVANGVTVVAGTNNTLDTVTPGAGNTITGNNSVPFITATHMRQTQAAPTITNLAWWDWGSAITDPGMYLAHRWQTTPATTTNIGRFFDGIAGAGTNLMSIAITSTGKLQVVESAGALLNVTSTASLSANTWYAFLIRYVVGTGAFTMNAYTQGSTTVAATVSGTMATGYSFRSYRFAVGTASSGMGYLDTDFGVAQIGSGGFAPRADVSISAPTVTADAAIDRVASASVSVHASASVSGDLISTLTGAFTVLPPGVTAPTLTGSATGTGTTSANLTQTFTPTVAGWYGWTATATGSSSGLSSTGLQMVYVSPVVGDPVPVRSVTSVGYSNIGGAASLLAALTDANDATLAESPSSPTGTSRVDVFMGPYGASGIKFNPKGVKVGADVTTRTVALYKSTQAGVRTGSPVYSTSYTLSTTAATPDVIVDGAGLAALSTADRREVCWSISDVV